MKTRVTLRVLMLSIVVAALALVPIRIYRKHQADRVQFKQLLSDHKIAVQMKETALAMARLDDELKELDRKMSMPPPGMDGMLAKLRLDLEEFERQRPRSRHRGRSGGALGMPLADAMKMLEQVATPPKIEGPRLRRNIPGLDLDECTRKEAEARAAIERWRATHWWF